MKSLSKNIKSEFNVCPTCGSIKSSTQPEPINGTQDVFYVCKGATTYDVNSGDAEQTGNCENKIKWENVYVEYGSEFDESAKIVDNRFFGWVEFQFYQSLHSGKWIMENPEKSPTSKECLDEYFENKEMYARKMRDPLGRLPTGMSTKVVREVVKDYIGDVHLGRLIMEEVDRIESNGLERIILRVIACREEPKRVGGYVVENNQLGGDSSVDFYDREVIQVILRNEDV